jgi:hypothetical protein
MKTKLLLLFVGIISLMTLTSCSDDEDNNPFVGKWHMVSFEQNGVVRNNYNPSCKTFLSNGHIKSNSNYTITYCYDGQYLYVHYNGPKTYEVVYSYYFSDKNNTLKVKYVKIDLWGGYSSIASTYVDVGRTEVYNRIKE